MANPSTMIGDRVVVYVKRNGHEHGHTFRVERTAARYALDEANIGGPVTVEIRRADPALDEMESSGWAYRR